MSEIKTKEFVVLLFTSVTASMLRGSLYHTIDLIIRSLLLPAKGSKFAYSGISRFGKILEKKVFNTQTVSMSFEIMSSLPFVFK